MSESSSARPVSSRPRRVRPYPLSELPRLLRVQVELGRALWLHLSSVIDAAAISTEAGRGELAQALGGPLKVQAQDPYLQPVERMEALLRGGVLLGIETQTPARLTAVLAVDQALCGALRLGEPALQQLLQRSLRGAAVRVFPLTLAVAVALLSESSSRMCLAMELLLATKTASGWGRLFCGSELRLAVVPRSGAGAPPLRWQHRDRLLGLTTELSIEAGYGFLRGQDVLNLRPQDVVVLDRFGPRPITGGPVSLRLGNGAFTAHLDGAGVTVMSSFHLRAYAMADDTSDLSTSEPALSPMEPSSQGASAAASAAQEHLLRELPVQITCEIGRITLSAREVLDLRPGTVLPVGRPLAGPVDLTAGGRVIARGELVDVEGEIGVRVSEVLE